MDLNYVFHRQQVERSKAQAAASAEARRTHLELARRYEAEIERASHGLIRFRGEVPPAGPPSEG